MKRGCKIYSIELIKEALELPDSFNVSGIKFECKTNTVEIYGYDENCENILEGCMPLPESEFTPKLPKTEPLRTVWVEHPK